MFSKEMPPNTNPRGGRAGRGAGARQANEYHEMLTRIGLSFQAITALEAHDLDSIQAFNNFTDDDVPVIVKELQ